MNIKSSQDLVNEANQVIETLDPTKVKLMTDNKECTLIDVRDIRELWKEGTIKNSKHIPRGMLEFWLDPESPYFKNGKLDMEKEIILFCAGGLRSALAAKSLKEMGFENVSHIDGGFALISQSDFKIS